MKTPYSVRKVKTFRGMDGEGLNAELLRDGVPVAFAVNEGSGGETRFDWYDPKAHRVEVLTTIYDGKPMKCQMTPEEAKFYDFTKDMVYPADATFPKPLPMGMDGYIEELINDDKVRKQMVRACKTKTCYRLKSDKPGSFWTASVEFSPLVAMKIRAKNGDNLEVIYNETL